MFPPDSARLRFREIQPDDFSMLFRLQSDPATMRYIRRPESDPKVVEERIRFWAAYRATNPGLGVWVAETLDKGDFAGHCVLREADWLPGSELEIGYVIALEYWGMGLATEIAGALCRHAFAHFPVGKLIAFTHPDNQASQNVLKKCGFEPLGLENRADGESLRHELKRAAFLLQ